MNIRLEIKKDYRIVEELIRNAFWNIYTPGCNEHFVIHNLRKSEDFIPELDLLIEENDKIIAHIAYTRGVVKDNKNIEHSVISFGPVSVIPELKNKGIGSKLITHSLNAARGLGYKVVIICGDPRYYHRFGFRCAEKYDITAADGKYMVALMALELEPGALKNISGRFIESPAFSFDENEFNIFENTFARKEKAETASQLDFKVLSSLCY